MHERSVAGASSAASLVFRDRLISRVHAELDPRPDGLWVRDLGSRNGTFIEGVRVQIARVPDGGTLRLGETDIRVEYGPPEAPPGLWPQDRFGALLGRCTRMRELFSALARVAPSDASVLIHGETGTGKELVARALHEASARATGPFVVVDCGALSESLLDAELFGHTKGAFTGAVVGRAGAIEEADGGTVFLDEIGEVPLSLQPKLLRVLEARAVRRLGEVSYRQVDVRFVAATHRDLLEMVARGDFREDLYFRLAVLPVFVPPLRERVEDIPLLARHFSGDDVQKLPSDLFEAMKYRNWRGNVRELRNFVERAKALGPAGALALMQPQEDASPKPDATIPPPPAPLPAEPTPSAIPMEQPFKTFREQWIEAGERSYIRALLARAPRISDASRLAGLNRTYLYRLVRKYIP